MTNPTRRSVLRGSLALASAGALARPYIANAAATTATVWWVQGFAEEEDISFKKIVADYEKASGNTIDYTHHALCADAPEDRLGDDQRRRPGSVPEQPRRDHRALCLGRQAGRRDRCRRDPKIAIHRNRAAHRQLLQQRREAAQLLRRALYRARCDRTISGGRWSRRPATRSKIFPRLGMRSTISSRKCRRSCAPRAMRNV